MLVIDHIIASIITKNYEYTKAGYPEYFFKQIKLFINKQTNKAVYLVIYEELRKIGDNDQNICELIRKNLISGFISYTDKNKIDLTSEIDKSWCETNQFLIENNLSLVEYSAFFDLVQIVKYLHQKEVELKPSLWLYAIHSNSKVELFNFLNENNVKITEEIYKK